MQSKELTIFEKLETFGITLEELHYKNFPKIVVSFSGGRDSQACLKIACDKYGADNVLAAFADVKNEHPTTYKHIDRVICDYGCGFAKYTAGTVYDVVDKRGYFPNDTVRFCTSLLKLRPAKYFECCLSAENDCKGFTVYVGIRGDEGMARQKRYKETYHDEVYTKNDIMGSMYPNYMHKRYNVYVQMPLLDSSLGDVIHLLGDTANPLYAQGQESVGCFPCLAAGDKAKQHAFEMDAFGLEQYNRFSVLAKKHNIKLFTGKKTAHLNGCLFCRM